jgi:Mg-chelatase subunit ChlD
MSAVAELHYRITGASRGQVPGHHRSRHGGNGFEFRGHANLHDAPDARRIDVHASLRDPFGRWIVRLHQQRLSIPVAVVADLSASMGAVGGLHKQGMLADLVESLAWSAWRTGDSFGFVGCDAAVRRDLLLPQTRARGAGTALAATLRTLQLEGRSAHGLKQALWHLPRRRALVFLVSDFHLPLPDVAAVLAHLAQHEVLPVVLWPPQEFDLGTRRGLADVAEPESGRRQWLWWRPALRQRWQAAAQQRRADLLALFRAQRLSPLFIEGAFDADAVTRHFCA